MVDNFDRVASASARVTPIFIPTWGRPNPRCLKILDNLPKMWRKFIHFVTPEPTQISHLAEVGYDVVECVLPGGTSDMVATRQFILDYSVRLYGVNQPFITMDDDVNSLGVLYRGENSSKVMKGVAMENVFYYLRYLADRVVLVDTQNVGIVIPRHRLFSNHVSNSETLYTLGSSSYETQFAVFYPRVLGSVSYHGCSPDTAENLYLYLRMLQKKIYVATLPSVIYSAHYSETESHFWSDDESRKLRHNREFELMRDYFPEFADYIVPKATYPDGTCRGQKFNNRKFAKDHPWFPRRRVVFDG